MSPSRTLRRAWRVPCRSVALATLWFACASGAAYGQAGAPQAAGAAPAAPAAAAAQGALDGHRREDIVRHRAIAAAHDAAARCLESGQKESICHDTLRKACAGIAVGRYCGMKHSH
jgi:hypothetical protein